MGSYIQHFIACVILAFVVYAESELHLVVKEPILVEDKSKVVKNVNSTVSELHKFCDVELDFSNMNFGNINENFILSPHVKSLNLQYNGIQMIKHGALDGMPNLKRLDLTGNQIRPKDFFSFGGHPQLETLILNENIRYENGYWYGDFDVHSVIQITDTLPNLKHLSVRNVFIKNISSNWSTYLPSLTHLDLSENVLNLAKTRRFESTDSSVDYRQALTNRIFEVLPDTVTDLRMEKMEMTRTINRKLGNLLSLSLDGNSFETISAYYCYDKTLCLENLENLRNLSVSNCKIRKIEDDAFKGMTSLLRLNLSMNRLRKLSNKTFHHLEYLTELDLSGNHFLTLPPVCILSRLETFILNDMKSRSFYTTNFCHLPMLTTLSLRKNSIRQIEESFLNAFPLLEDLDLSENLLESVPFWSTQAPLRHFYLRDNGISSLDNLPLQEASSLVLLDLTNNTIKSFSLRVLKSLPEIITILL